jgi:tetratricopeptide (TPR) repeat protein
MTLTPQEDVYDVAFSPDGRTIGALSVEGIILWETVEPSGGYELREAGQMARRLTAEVYQKHDHWANAIDELRADSTLDEPVRKLALQVANARKWEDVRKVVDKLYEKHGLYHEVIAELQVDRDLDEPVRTLALQIANYHLWSDVQKLSREAAKVALLPDKDIETYREALAKAQQANGWDPNNWRIVGVMGMAQYRTGLYEETLRAFKRAAELRLNEGGEPQGGHITLAFTAMILHQLGRAGEARSTLEELRALLKDERFANSEVAKALLAEAEKLIGGEK